MFQLAEIEDTIRVEPKHFYKESAQAILDQVNAKYANRAFVLRCMTCCERVKEEYVVFRPFTNEVLVGRICSSTQEGLRVSMGFYDDISIPPHLIPTPHAFDYQEQAWFWLLDPSEEQMSDPLQSPPEERMYLDVGETIRFAIESDQFYDVEPGPAVGEGKLGETPSGVGILPGAQGAQGSANDASYRITGTIAGQGLGLVAWWAGAEQVPVDA